MAFLEGVNPNAPGKWTFNLGMMNSKFNALVKSYYNVSSLTVFGTFYSK